MITEGLKESDMNQNKVVNELQTTITSLKLTCSVKENIIKALKEDIKTKDETNNILVAKNNSLEENKNSLTRSLRNKDEKCMKLSLAIKPMDEELKELKHKALGEENVKQNNKSAAQQEIKSLQTLLRKKEAAVKEQQTWLNEKNIKIASLEADVSRLQMLADHTKVLSKVPSSKEKVKIQIVKQTRKKFRHKTLNENLKYWELLKS